MPSIWLVVDIGKTAAKLSAWNTQGDCIARYDRRNVPDTSGIYDALDVTGIENFLVDSLIEAGRLGDVRGIIPVAHGAAAAVLRDGALVVPVMDYEFEIPQGIVADYAAQRDPSALSGSPLMGQGLNLARQFHFLELRHPGIFDEGTEIVPWPQFWAWRLSGVARCELTSLGAHTDLWDPRAAKPSPMAKRRGWADRFAPLAKAGEQIGTLTREWQVRTGLGPDVAVYAGLHDSNSALNAARGRAHFAKDDATILSTGTWFVTLRSLAPGAAPRIEELSRVNGCLVNVDIAARPVPTGLFMGGREFEQLALHHDIMVDDPAMQAPLARAAGHCITNGAMAMPCWQAGTGPFPNAVGSWVNRPSDPLEEIAAAVLYLALVADYILELVGTQRLLVVDGRFANIEIFAGAIAALRPDLEITIANAENDVALGALRAMKRDYPVAQELQSVPRIAANLNAYRNQWRDLALKEQGMPK